MDCDMKNATAKTPTEAPDIDDLEETMPLQTLDHLLQDSAGPERPVSRDGQELVVDLLFEQLVRIAMLAESIDGRLNEVVELLKRR